MKIKIAATVIASLSLVASAFAETSYQSAEGEAAYTPEGGNAIEKGLLEVKSVGEASGGKVVRVKGDMQQWGFVSYWFGAQVPAGKATLRFRVYVDGQQASEFGVYIIAGSEQSQAGKLGVPADAKQGSFIDVDIPVDMKGEWSGVAVKKIEESSAPSPWIDSVSVILP